MFSGVGGAAGGNDFTDEAFFDFNLIDTFEPFVALEVFDVLELTDNASDILHFMLDDTLYWCL